MKTHTNEPAPRSQQQIPLTQQPLSCGPGPQPIRTADQRPEIVSQEALLQRMATSPKVLSHCSLPPLHVPYATGGVTEHRLKNDAELVAWIFSLGNEEYKAWYRSRPPTDAFSQAYLDAHYRNALAHEEMVKDANDLLVMDHSTAGKEAMLNLGWPVANNPSSHIVLNQVKELASPERAVPYDMPVSFTPRSNKGLLLPDTIKVLATLARHSTPSTRLSVVSLSREAESPFHGAGRAIDINAYAGVSLERKFSLDTPNDMADLGFMISSLIEHLPPGDYSIGLPIPEYYGNTNLTYSRALIRASGEWNEYIEMLGAVVKKNLQERGLNADIDRDKIVTITRDANGSRASVKKIKYVFPDGLRHIHLDVLRVDRSSDKASR